MVAAQENSLWGRCMKWHLQGSQFQTGKCSNSSCTDGCAIPRTYLKPCIVLKALFKDVSYILCKLHLNYSTTNSQVIGVNLRSSSKGHLGIVWTKQHSREDKGSVAPCHFQWGMWGKIVSCGKNCYTPWRTCLLRALLKGFSSKTPLLPYPFQKFAVTLRGLNG